MLQYIDNSPVLLALYDMKNFCSDGNGLFFLGNIETVTNPYWVIVFRTIIGIAIFFTVVLFIRYVRFFRNRYCKCTNTAHETKIKGQKLLLALESYQSSLRYFNRANRSEINPDFNRDNYQNGHLTLLKEIHNLYKEFIKSKVEFNCVIDEFGYFPFSLFLHRSQIRNINLLANDIYRLINEIS